MEDRFTTKETQLYRLLHELRKVLGNGKIHIDLHNFDFANVQIEKTHLAGENEQELDKFQILLSTVFGGGLTRN